MQEIWKDIQGYEGLYQISNLGNVKSLVMDKTLKKLADNNGYLKVALYKNRKPKRCSIHRLVAEAFVDNISDKPVVNHRNGDKHDNRATNLEWVTHKENMQHAYRTGLKVGINHKNNKLSIPVAQYDKNFNLIKIYPSMNEAERDGFSAAEICKCCKGKNKTSFGYIWKYA